MARTYRLSDDGRRARAERMKAMNADPEFKAKHAAAARERMKAMHADPEFKAKHAERMKAMHADPEFKAKHAERMKAMHADPEFKAKHAERMKAMNADPEFNPLAALNDRGRQIYKTLRRKGCTFEEAFREAQREAVPFTAGVGT